MKIFIRPLLLFFLALTCAAPLSAAKSAKELGNLLFEFIRNNDTYVSYDELAPLDVYRTLAPSQLGGKSDEEVWMIVNQNAAPMAKLARVTGSLREMNIDPAALTLASVKPENIKMLHKDYYHVHLFVSYEGTRDTLTIEAFVKAKEWYFVDVSADDDKLGNIISKKGKITSETYFMRANSLRNEFRYEEAIANYTKALEMDPKNTDYLFALATLQSDAFDMENARKNLETLEKMIPDSVKIYEPLAAAARHAGDYRSALRYLDKASLLEPHTLSYYTEKAEIYKLNEEFDSAETELKKIIEKDTTGDVYFKTNLAVFYKERGRYDEFVKIYEDLMNASPGDPDAVKNYIWSLNEAKRYDEAIRVTDLELEKAPDDSGLLYEKGYSFFKMKKFPEARKLFRDAVDKGTTISDATYRLGWIDNELGRHDSAEKTLLALVGSGYENPDIWYEIGYAQKRLGKYKEAIESYKKSDEVFAFQANDIDKGKLYDEIGSAYEALGDTSEACTYYHLAIENGNSKNEKFTKENCR